MNSPVHVTLSECTCPACVLIAARRAENALPIFTIFDRPADFRDGILVRMFLNDKPTPNTWKYLDLAAARAAMESLALNMFPRDPTDPPMVVESWI